MDSISEKQKAYHLRKMRTRMQRMDVNNDGHISREDFELMGKNLVELTPGIAEKQKELIFVKFAQVADDMGLKPGVKFGLEEAAKTASDMLLSKTRKKSSEVHDMLFDCIDTNNDGHISMEEFKIYFNVIGHNISDEEVKHAFETIDVNDNGEISREEFSAAALEFFYGLEETELSKVFYGNLLP